MNTLVSFDPTFQPYIKVNNSRIFRPEGWLSKGAYARARRIMLPKGTQGQRDELEIVYAACQEHQRRYVDLWSEGGNYEYYRACDEIVQLDDNGRVIG